MISNANSIIVFYYCSEIILRKRIYIYCLRQFLYPSEEDMYKLIRFLVGRLSESSRTAVSPDSKYTSNADAMVIIEDVGNSFKDATGDEGLDLHTKVEGLRLKTEEDMSVIVGVNKGGNVETDNVGLTGVENGVDLNQRNYVGGTGGDMSQDGGQHELEQAPVSVSENLSQASITFYLKFITIKSHLENKQGIFF